MNHKFDRVEKMGYKQKTNVLRLPSVDQLTKKNYKSTKMMNVTWDVDGVVFIWQIEQWEIYQI